MRLFSPNDKKKTDPAAGIRAVRRSLSYIIRVILLTIAGVLVCVLAFFEAERLSNLYILATEGMSLRADAILGETVEQDALREYFMLICLNEDSALTAGTYAPYTVSDHDYDLSIEKISVLPWASTASVTAVETVNVKGGLTSSDDTAHDPVIPAWQTVRYRIDFVNVGTRWYISSLTVLDTNPAGKVLLTPDPHMSPLPMATPTPTPLPDIEVIDQ